MLINEVCKECSLTKKAIEYYEKQGLIRPKIEENGYRNYSAEDVLVLKEIFVLRNLGLGIPEIKDIISSSDKHAALSKYKYLKELEKQRIDKQQKGLELLIENYQVEPVKQYIEEQLSPLLTIKEKLAQSFPGGYGIYLSVHFGRFLNETINSNEKKRAYQEILSFLDHLEINEEIEEFLKSSMALFEQEDLENMDTVLFTAVENIEEYMETNKQRIEKYIRFREFEEYKSTDAYKMQQLLLEFQKQSGYTDIFITNLKILSDSYRDYYKKLEEANERFIKSFPQMSKGEVP
ncbi:MerR family transcriptional regulator [Robertmurraya siralis]|uniref:MerR family transcriptional regulator n=1 Tax=Robertmurraya siralis TaxID=77777 RepID=A0A919WHN8_9BACI|nr:MerR family transcriptional regulator [Robertmurraya siralis]GIN62201.1 MerR family transcriptional regulator [Robertmurraya siralis]